MGLGIAALSTLLADGRPLLRRAGALVLGATVIVVGIRFTRRVRGTDATVVVALTYTAVAVAGGLLALDPAVLVGDTNLGLGVFGPDSVPPLSLLRAPKRFTLLFTLGVSASPTCSAAEGGSPDGS